MIKSVANKILIWNLSQNLSVSSLHSCHLPSLHCGHFPHHSVGSHTSNIHSEWSLLLSHLSWFSFVRGSISHPSLEDSLLAIVCCLFSSPLPVWHPVSFLAPACGIISVFWPWANSAIRFLHSQCVSYLNQVVDLCHLSQTPFLHFQLSSACTRLGFKSGLYKVLNCMTLRRAMDISKSYISQLQTRNNECLIEVLQQLKMR